MIFSPIGCLISILFILSIPILLALGYFHIITLGFQKLGLTTGTTISILVLMLLASAISIPISKRKFYEQEKSFFGFFKKSKIMASGIAINLGGAVIPILLSLYFLIKVELKPVLIATLLMIVVSKYLAKVVPGKGIMIPCLIPPLFAMFFAFILAPEFAAPCAFISGVFGTLIGGDILNLRKARKLSPGMISIGGAGVFDGIFLIGIVSALFS